MQSPNPPTTAAQSGRGCPGESVRGSGIPQKATLHCGLIRAALLRRRRRHRRRWRRINFMHATSTSGQVKKQQETTRRRGRGRERQRCPTVPIINVNFFITIHARVAATPPMQCTARGANKLTLITARQRVRKRAQIAHKTQPKRARLINYAFAAICEINTAQGKGW